MIWNYGDSVPFRAAPALPSPISRYMQRVNHFA